MTIDYQQLYIDGDWSDAAGSNTTKVINPATEAVIGSVPESTIDDAERAVLAARRSFDDGGWSTLTPRQRALRIEPLYDSLVARRDEIVDLIVAETGATRPTAKAAHFDMAMHHFRHAIDETLVRNEIETMPISIGPNPMTGGEQTGLHLKIREPRGVVTAVTPYNFPYFLNVGKLAPALLMGNSTILKPSPYTPLQALLLGEEFAKLDLPPGVINLLTDGPGVSELVTSHPEVDMVTFTGSDTVGVKVMEQGARTVKHVVLELGGKSAMVILDDADVELAAMMAAFGITVQAGQGCGLFTRILVHESLEREVIDRMVAVLSGVVTGDPSDPSVTMGPLIRESQRARVEHYVANGLDNGAELATGGARPDGLDRGFFYLPTLLTGVDNSLPVAQDEIFGPVVVMTTFTDDDEAIAIANQSSFGLAGAVMTRDTARAIGVARRIRAGYMLVNGGAGGMNPHLPFGGYKRSGLGREYGVEGLNEFTEVKSVSIPV